MGHYLERIYKLVIYIFFTPSIHKKYASPVINDNLQFPDGTRFYPDIRNGERGYNTDPARGADTFRPFKQDITFKSVKFIAVASGSSDAFSYVIPDKISVMVVMYVKTTASVNIPAGHYLEVPVYPAYNGYARFYNVKKGQTFNFSAYSSSGNSAAIQVCVG